MAGDCQRPLRLPLRHPLRHPLRRPRFPHYFPILPPGSCQPGLGPYRGDSHLGCIHPRRTVAVHNAGIRGRSRAYHRYSRTALHSRTYIRIRQFSLFIMRGILHHVVAGFR